MKKFLFPLCGLFVLYAQATFAETVYRGTDANGNTVYSDKPLPNSEKIEIAPVQTYTPPPPSPSPDLAIENEAPIEYQISIIDPLDQDTFPHSTASIPVKIEVSPALGKGDEIRLLVNGEPYGAPSKTPVFELKELYRGAYQLKAEIVSISDPTHPKAESNPITIYQQRASVFNKKN